MTEKSTFRVDWRILAVPSATAVMVVGLINIGTWKGTMQAKADALDVRMTKAEQCIQKLSDMQTDISKIKGYLEGRNEQHPSPQGDNKAFQ